MGRPKLGHVKYTRRVPAQWVKFMDECLAAIRAGVKAQAGGNKKKAP